MNTDRLLPGHIFDGLFSVETIAAVEAAVTTVLRCYSEKDSDEDRETGNALGESANALRLLQDRWHAYEKEQRSKT